MRRIFLALAFVLVFGLRLPRASASTAADICPAAANPCVVSTAKIVTPGSTLDFGARQLNVTTSGSITVNGGMMTILAGSVRVETHGRLIGAEAGGSAGSIEITTTGDVLVETGIDGDGLINVSAPESPGSLRITAGGNVTIGGKIQADGPSTFGSGGVIDITASGLANVTGTIQAKGGAQGLGGEINVFGANVTNAGIIRADAADGGDVDIEALSGNLSAGGQINASAGGTFGDGGSVLLAATNNVTINGSVLIGGAGSLIEGGGTGGDADIEATAGSVTVSGTIENHGAAPDGDAGETDILGGLDYIQSGFISAPGNGADGCGGFFSIDVPRNINMTGDVDLHGGFCGGDLLAFGGNVTIASTSDINADGGESGGSISFTAEQINVAGKLHAEGTESIAFGGLIELQSCTMSIPSGASLKSDAASGSALNLLQVGGQLTIGGQISSKPIGVNRFEYRDPSKPPITLGTAQIQPARDCAPAAGCLTPTLPACGTVAVCGNNIHEGGEDCDDGNTNACDGCSPTCQSEGCGNGTIECGEECDDGPSNGGPGDPCDIDCHVVTGANTIFVPSSHRGNGCMLEWAIKHAPVAGFPPSTIDCVDGDPDCDADGVTDGGCTFHVAACLNVTDVRIPSCVPHNVESLNLRRPSPTDPADAIEDANAQALVPALGGLGMTLRSRSTFLQAGTPQPGADHCSATVSQRVPHPPGGVGRRLLSAGGEDTDDHSVSNRIVLSCAPNPAVCGNDVREIGEQCDDGNTAACDGCSENCRVERCGDGIIQCGEQCDDGTSNGQPGSTCSATCTEPPPDNRIPGGKSVRDCLAEWSLATNSLVTSRNGLPSTKQICVDNDPGCDFDPAVGTCRFHLWTCIAADDSRLGCVADTVVALNVVKPSAKQTGPPASARQEMLETFADVAVPAGPGEVCSRRMDLDLPAGKKKLSLKDEATSISGSRDRDSLKLICAPVGTVP